MAQHFLLTAAARDSSLSIRKVLAFSDDEARTAFAKLRWGQSETQTCPHCGVVKAHRYVRLQKRWRCRDCYKGFSVTSGTVFNHHKMPLQAILGAIVIYANAVKGLSALQLSRDLNVQYKTAFVLLHKLRETLWKTQDDSKLSGEVEIDGGYMHTYVRPKNKKVDRKDTRLAENQNQNKCAVLVLRQRSGEKGKGAQRTKVFVIPSETDAYIRPLVTAHVEVGATVITDESPGYTMLGAKWAHKVVNHSKEYQSEDGANENQAESYIARFRRMVMGQIHKLAPKNLEAYANEAAFREDRRRQSNGYFVRELTTKCLHTGQSRRWGKYWQLRHSEKPVASG
jgi:transposase-like protein